LEHSNQRRNNRSRAAVSRRENGNVIPTMRILQINSDIAEKRRIPDEVVRQMSDLLGSNMTRLTGCTHIDWQSDANFQKWKHKVFLGDVQKHTRHILLVDDDGLKGFISYTVPPEASAIYLNEIQIRASAQGDGVTLRVLILRFLDEARRLPHKSVRTYTSKLNDRAQHLIEKAGFRLEEQTERGFRYTASKGNLLARFRPTAGTPRLMRDVR